MITGTLDFFFQIDGISYLCRFQSGFFFFWKRNWIYSVQRFHYIVSRDTRSNNILGRNGRLRRTHADGNEMCLARETHHNIIIHVAPSRRKFFARYTGRSAGDRYSIFYDESPRTRVPSFGLFYPSSISGLGDFYLFFFFPTGIFLFCRRAGSSRL